MLASLSIIFGFMIFMLILRKGQILFFNISSWLIMASISLGVGYGIAVFITSMGMPLLICLGIIITILFVSLNKGGG